MKLNRSWRHRINKKDYLYLVFLITVISITLVFTGHERIRRKNEVKFQIMKTKLFQIKQKNNEISGIGIFAQPLRYKRITFSTLHDFPFELKNQERFRDLIITETRIDRCLFNKSNKIFIACPIEDNKFKEDFPFVIRQEENLYFWTTYERTNPKKDLDLITQTKRILNEDLIKPDER